MNSKTKTISILIVTLLIGMLIGGALVGRIVKVRVDRFQSFTSEQGFISQYSEIIGEMSDEQRVLVEPVLRKAGSDMAALMQDSRNGFSDIINRVESELAGHLTDEQLNAIKERRETIRTRLSDRRGR